MQLSCIRLASFGLSSVQCDPFLVQFAHSWFMDLEKQLGYQCSHRASTHCTLGMLQSKQWGEMLKLLALASLVQCEAF